MGQSDLFTHMLPLHWQQPSLIHFFCPFTVLFLQSLHLGLFLHIPFFHIQQYCVVRRHEFFVLKTLQSPGAFGAGVGAGVGNLVGEKVGETPPPHLGSKIHLVGFVLLSHRQHDACLQFIFLFFLFFIRSILEHTSFGGVG